MQFQGGGGSTGPDLYLTHFALCKIGKQSLAKTTQFFSRGVQIVPVLFFSMIENGPKYYLNF